VKLIIVSIVAMESIDKLFTQLPQFDSPLISDNNNWPDWLTRINLPEFNWQMELPPLE